MCLKLVVIVVFVFNDKRYLTQPISPVHIRKFNVSSPEKRGLHVEPQVSAGVAKFDRHISSPRHSSVSSPEKRGLYVEPRHSSVSSPEKRSLHRYGRVLDLRHSIKLNLTDSDPAW